MSKFKDQDLFDMIPKNLRIAIAHRIQNAKPSYISIYATIVDRFNVKSKNLSDKYCFDSNRMIEQRSGHSKVTIECAISWILTLKFLVAEYLVTESGPLGAVEHKFSDYKEALNHAISLRKKRTHCKGPKRALKPPQEVPSLEELGLLLVDKNNGLYYPSEISNSEDPGDKNNSAGYKKKAPRTKENSLSGDKNYGLKLDAPNEMSLNQMNRKLDQQNDTEKMNTIKSLPSIDTFNDFKTVDDALNPYSRKSLTSGKEYNYDPNFATCLIALNTLRLSNFYGEANYKLSRSQLRNTVVEITFGHFLYAAFIFKDIGKPDWFDGLIDSFQEEVPGLTHANLDRYIAELSQ